MKKYISIYENLKKDITDGVYKTGEKLPSKRTLADQWGVSIITVEHAYELLLEEGYIESVEKSGYFVLYEAGDLFYGRNDIVVSNKVNDNVLKESHIENKDDCIIKSSNQEAHKKNDYLKTDNGLKRKLSAGSIVNTDLKSIENNNYISFDIYSKTVRKVLSAYPDEVMSKSPSFGMPELKKSISDYLLRSRNIRVSPKQIVIGAGAEYLYGMVVRVFGTDVIYGIESPGYRRIKEVYEKDGAKTDMLKLRKDGIESKELSRTNAGILHITPYRSYPTGITATAGKKYEYLQWAKERDAILVEDDFESEFTPSRKAVDTLFSMDNEGRVIYINTFSRTISPAIRMAYMLVPDRLLDLFTEKISFFSCPVPTLEQLTVSQLLDSGEFEKHINRVRRNLRNSRA